MTGHYDPLLAKLLAVGPDRAVALARLRTALAGFDVGGLQTTIPFHRWLVDFPDFAEASGLATDLVARAWRPAPLVERLALQAAEVAARAALTRRAPRPAFSDAAAGAWWQAGVDDELADRP